MKMSPFYVEGDREFVRMSSAGAVKLIKMKGNYFYNKKAKMCAFRFARSFHRE